jgi:hypothetical protein
MADRILVNTAGFDQSPALAAASTSLSFQVTYYVARTLVLYTGERLADVPVSRRVTSIGVANRLLKRACRRRVMCIWCAHRGACVTRRRRLRNLRRPTWHIDHSVAPRTTGRAAQPAGLWITAPGRHAPSNCRPGAGPS